MRSVIKYYVLLLIVLISTTKQTFAQADILLYNGKIFTADTGNLYVQALAIKGNKIMAAGANKAIAKLAGNRTKRIDLKGKTVIPGINDAHDHAGFLVPIRKSFDAGYSLEGPDKKSVIDSVAHLLQNAKPGEWISGMIGMAVFTDTSMRAALDSLAPNNPVHLQNPWGHGLILNSYALKLLHIADDEPDPLGGWHVRKPNSNLITGAMYEYAQWPVWRALAAAEPDHFIQQLRLYAGEQIKMGITTVQFMDLLPQTNDYFVKADLPQRIRLIPFISTTKTGRDLGEWANVDVHPTPLVYVSGSKYLIDGTPFEEGCLNRKPYPGKPYWYGRTDMPVDTIEQILREAYNSNTQLMMHIAGDSMGIVLGLMKQIGQDSVWKRKRVRFEHNATNSATAADIQMIKEMGIVMAHTPKFGHRCRLRSFLDKGIIVSISPDGTINPFDDMLTMTSKQTDPVENITMEQVVIAYTRTNAWAEFAEKTKGILMPGMLADLTVLSRDIFTIPAAQLPATKSVLTMVDGQIKYKE